MSQLVSVSASMLARSVFRVNNFLQYRARAHVMEMHDPPNAFMKHEGLKERGLAIGNTPRSNGLLVS